MSNGSRGVAAGLPGFAGFAGFAGLAEVFGAAGFGAATVAVVATGTRVYALLVDASEGAALTADTTLPDPPPTLRWQAMAIAGKTPAPGAFQPPLRGGQIRVSGTFAQQLQAVLPANPTLLITDEALRYVPPVAPPAPASAPATSPAAPPAPAAPAVPAAPQIDETTVTAPLPPPPQTPPETP